MTQRILSIDIDCVMEPCIPRYDDDVVGSRIVAKDEWATVEHPPESLTFCAKRWALVKRIYAGAKTKKIVFGNNHHQVLDFIPEGPLEIHNFDHHHDIEYPGWNDDLEIHEGNWVGHLNKGERVASYTWYRNANSEDLMEGVPIPPNYREELLPDVEVPGGDFALLFVCLSPNWTPPHYWYLRKELSDVAPLDPEAKIIHVDSPPNP